MSSRVSCKYRRVNFTLMQYCFNPSAHCLGTYLFVWFSGRDEERFCITSDIFSSSYIGRSTWCNTVMGYLLKTVVPKKADIVLGLMFWFAPRFSFSRPMVIAWYDRCLCSLEFALCGQYLTLTWSLLFLPALSMTISYFVRVFWDIRELQTHSM